MYVVFDLSTANTIRIVCLFPDKQSPIIYTAIEKNIALLSVYDAALTAVGVDTRAVEGIGVVVGVGTFTSTRIAATVANAIGYAAHIPVCAVSLEEAEAYSTVHARLAAVPVGEYISATYSGDPRIGTMTL